MSDYNPDDIENDDNFQLIENEFYCVECRCWHDSAFIREAQYGEVYCGICGGHLWLK